MCLGAHCFWRPVVLVNFQYWDEVLHTHNLKEEEFILTHSVRGFGSWLAGCRAEATWWKGSVAHVWGPGSREGEGEGSQGQESILPGYVPSNLPPLTRTYFRTSHSVMSCPTNV